VVYAAAGVDFVVAAAAVELVENVSPLVKLVVGLVFHITKRRIHMDIQ